MLLAARILTDVIEISKYYNGMALLPGTVDAEEIAKFEAMAEEWWDAHGKFRLLHRLNPTRIGYIWGRVMAHFCFEAERDKPPLQGISLLDVGCGGGLLAEPLCRLGAEVTGIDASEKNIRIAALHAAKMGLSIDYKAKTVEALAMEGNQFDVVLAMEIIEHVADIPLFLQHCAALVKPGGMAIVATINRTITSFLCAIIGAEYMLRWLPRGTHQWGKFVQPAEIAVAWEKHGMVLKHLQGVGFNPMRSEWFVTPRVSVNYMMFFEKGTSKNPTFRES